MFKPYAPAKIGNANRATPLPVALAAEELDACFVVKDGSAQKLVYRYYEDEPGRRSTAKLLTEDEARRIAENSARLPELRRQNTNPADRTRTTD